MPRKNLHAVALGRKGGRPIIALLFLLLATPASAQDWTVEHFRSGTVRFDTPVYGHGTYEFVRAPDHIPVYLKRDLWDFIGMYGAPYGGYPQAPLPESFPAISFSGSDNFAIVTPVTGVPEHALLRSFTKHIGGRQLNAAVNPALQRVTAWGAAKLLGASSRGVYVVLPTRILEIQEWCSGVSTMKWLALLALVMGLVLRASWAWTAALVVAAAMIGLGGTCSASRGLGTGMKRTSSPGACSRSASPRSSGSGW
jgi:Transmembrane exosortase (Exosortase_EpsH)